MADAAADWTMTVALMSEAFRLGENGRGEELLTAALDDGAPWDVVTAAAARALSERGRPVPQAAALEPSPA